MDEDDIFILSSGHASLAMYVCIEKYFGHGHGHDHRFHPLSFNIQKPSEIIPYIEKHIETTIDCIPKKLNLKINNYQDIDIFG